jgi:hypothetical protein
MNQVSPAHAPSASFHERRKRPDLRAVFATIIHRVEPFFRTSEGLNGSTTEYWAARVIHNAHPELSDHDVKVLIDAAARYYREQAQARTPEIQRRR